MTSITQEESERIKTVAHDILIETGGVPMMKSLGIIVWYGYGGGGKHGWWAKADIDNFRHCEPGAMTGKVGTKYIATMGDAIRDVLATLETLGVEMLKGPEYASNGIPYLYYLDDGESTDYPPPDGWRKMLRDEAVKFGLHTYEI